MTDLHRVVFEIQIRGLHSEVECLAKLHDHVNGLGKCVGSSSAYVCFFKDVVLKVMPRVEEGSRVHVQQIYEAFQQTIPILLVIEGSDVKELSSIVETVYLFARNCGLMVRLLE